MIGGEGGSWTKLDVTGHKRDPARERRIDESKTTLDQWHLKLRIPYFLPHAWQTCRISPMVDQRCPANCSDEARANSAESVMTEQVSITTNAGEQAPTGEPDGFLAYRCRARHWPQNNEIKQHASSTWNLAFAAPAVDFLAGSSSDTAG
jgi:hypothetical protein